MTATPPLTISLMPGDGIGPEITDALLHVFAVLEPEVGWETVPLGLRAHAEHGDALPPQTVDSLRRTGLGLKGPVQTPLIGGFRSPLVRLRETFQLYANLRPSRHWLPRDGAPPLDLVVVRENTEGLYSAMETHAPVGDDPQGLAIATCWNSRAGSERILRFAFDYALRHGRRKVTVVHKANVLKKLSGIFLETARQLHEEVYRGAFDYEEMIVDACAMKLVMAPERFDLLVSTNLFGDILSDLTAGLTGGLGMAPGANIGREVALFEAVHGSAPDIAGHGIANPIALLLSAALLLDHTGRTASAQRLRDAIALTLGDGVRTPDLGGDARCMDMARAIVARLA